MAVFLIALFQVLDFRNLSRLRCLSLQIIDTRSLLYIGGMFRTLPNSDALAEIVITVTPPLPFGTETEPTDDAWAQVDSFLTQHLSTTRLRRVVIRMPFAGFHDGFMVVFKQMMPGLTSWGRLFLETRWKRTTQVTQVE